MFDITSSNIVIIGVTILCLLTIMLIYHQPVIVPMEQHIIRIPVEDNVDLVVEDNHNVHNRCLKRIASQSIQELIKSDRHIYTIDTMYTSIQYMIEFSIDTDLNKLDDASESLRLIKQINAYYNSAEIGEMELIRLVWERVNHPDNSQVVEQLRSNIIAQLADCKNGYSGVHCCEGRIMRILQTLEKCDSKGIIDLKPMWAYKEEICSKIIQYRRKLLNNVPNQYAELDKKVELTYEDTKLLNQFNQCLVRNLNKRFEIDYISTGLLTPNELNDLTTEYYDNL